MQTQFLPIDLTFDVIPFDWIDRNTTQERSTVKSINYSDGIAQSINFIGRRSGYGSSVHVTVTAYVTLQPYIHSYASSSLKPSRVLPCTMSLY